MANSRLGILFAHTYPVLVIYYVVIQWQCNFLLEIRRFYGKDHGGGYDTWRRTSSVATPFNFDEAESTRPKGHCVAVRVTSEDPDDGFKPTSGKVQVSLSRNREPCCCHLLYEYLNLTLEVLCRS